jgi:hypothetical protein
MDNLVRADLHVHTALSPCADSDMKPLQTLLTAEQHSIAVLGVVDHSSARNAWAVLDVAEAFDVRVFVGLEVESAEGVHILALFDTAETAMAMDGFVAEHLPDLANRPDIFGEQHLVDGLGHLVGFDPRLLATAIDLSIEEIAEQTAAYGGMSLPAHIDRQANGLLPVLGFVPPGLRVDAFELSRHTSPADARRRWPQLAGLPLVMSSDAHYLEDIGAAATWISRDLAHASGSAREWGQALARELTARARETP